MEEKTGIFDRLKAGLSRTRNGGGGLAGIFSGGERINADFYDELEEALILADVGMSTAETLMDALKADVQQQGLTTREAAKELFCSLLADRMRPDTELLPQEGQAVILIVGVNGVGKTTTVGKLAAYYSAQGRRVMLAAADTFRAAAAEQLGIWADRAGVPMIKHGEGADPAAVVFDAAASFRAKGMDLLLCDTAGRLHNKTNLMNELAKIRRVTDRELPDARVEALLVLDAVTGQNALMQARAFAQSAGLTGVILTKLDGTAKGGVAVAVKAELGLPVRFVGIGENMDDIQPFDADAYARALIG